MNSEEMLRQTMPKIVDEEIATIADDLDLAQTENQVFGDAD